MNKLLGKHVLTLNKNWAAIDTCTVASAFGKLFSETCRFMDHQDDSLTLHPLESWLSLPVLNGDEAIRTAHLSLRIPEIIVMKGGVAPRKRAMQFSRRNLMRRDKGLCQYCGAKPTPEHTTVDHVLPKTKGGKSCWTNCVISCKPCNATKADRTLADSGMTLLPRPDMRLAFPHDQKKWTQPFVPAWSPVFRIGHQELRPSWEKFLPAEVWEAGKMGSIVVHA